MSKTQKEIAAPTTCCKKLSDIALVFNTASFIALAAYVLFAYKTALFTQNSVLAAIVLGLLLWLVIAAVTWGVWLKLSRPFYILLTFAAFMTTVFCCLLFTKDSVIAGNFTVKMLVLILMTAAIIAFAIFCISRFKENLDCVFAVVFSLFMTIPQLFSTLFATGTNFAANVWGIAGSSIIAVICSLFIKIFFVGREKKKITTKWITYCATFAALSIVFKIMGNSVSFIPTLRFTLTYIPWVLSGIVLGPAGGMITACVGDILGQLIMPAGFGNLNPIITLSNTLFALFPALLYKYSPIKSKYADQINIFIGMLISTVFCTLGLTSLGIWLYLPFGDNRTFFVILADRLFQPIIIAVNYGIIITLLPVLKRAKINNLKFWEFRTKNKPAAKKS